MVLFVTGHQRSGTGMLAELCNTHPDIAVTSELAVFERLDVSWASHCLFLLQRCWRKGRRPLLPHFGRESFTAWDNLRFVSRYVRILRANHDGLVDLDTVGPVLHRILPGARVVGDKYPDYIFDLGRHALRDDVKVVVIYRDCRDVTASTLEAVRTRWRHRRFRKKFDTVEKVAGRWILAMQLMQRYADRIMTIRYERLVREPGTVLSELGGWLGVDPSLFHHGFVHGRSVGRYRTRLTESQLAELLEIAEPTLSRFGYG